MRTPGQVSVTATTLGEVATGVNVFTITQTQPELLFVDPASRAAGPDAEQSPSPASTRTSSASTTANFGSGITVNSVTCQQRHFAQANITVQPTGHARLSHRLCHHRHAGRFQPDALPGTHRAGGDRWPEPGTGGQGICDRAGHRQPDPLRERHHHGLFGGGISVTGVTVTDVLHANVTITIPNSTPLGAYNVTLTTGGEVATILGGFTVTTGAPNSRLSTRPPAPGRDQP